MMLGKKATCIFVASDGMEKFFPSARLLKTGNPVRKNVVANQISREEGLNFFGLDASTTTVLVTGGSLGARSMNEAIDAGISLLIKNQIQLIWQTGKSFSAQAAAHAAESKMCGPVNLFPKWNMHMLQQILWFPDQDLYCMNYVW